MAEIQWSDAQKEAFSAAGENILVSAAAGSGKTTVLVERVIRLITRKEAPVDIDRLLVMTFTRAAAAQMKQKIYRALKEKVRLEPENAWLRLQLMKVQNAKICTIDSLCSEIVRDHIEDIDLDPLFRIAEEAELRLLQRDVLDNLLEECYQEGTTDFLSLAEYYMDKNDKKLDEIILKLYRYAQSHPEPEPWIRACAYPYQDAKQLYAQDRLYYPEGFKNWMNVYKKHVIRNISEIRQMALEGLEISESNYGPAPYADLFREILELIESMKGTPLDDRRSRIESFLNDWKTAPRITKKNTDVDENLKERARKVRKEIRTRLEELVEKYLYDDLEGMCREIQECAPIAETITHLVLSFSERLEKAKKERNIADFSDVAHYALRVLIRYDEEGRILRDEKNQPLYTAAADLLAGSLEEVIVDEYQDTNMLQEYLVQALSGERFGRPNVFMVGDVKQSIYGFRMACPELFSRKMRLYQRRNTDGRLIVLERNYRSRREILDLTNLVFQNAMIREVGGIAYKTDGHDLVYVRNGEDPETDGLRFVPEITLLQGSGEQGKNLEAYEIASKIEQLVSEGPYRYRDIVILTRTSDNPQLEQILYRRGIPVLKSSGKGFFDSFEIRLFLDLLGIIDNPLQDIPFTAVLYSPLCNVSAENLAEIRLAGGKKDTIYECLQKYVDSGDGTQERSYIKRTLAGFLERLETWRMKASCMDICDFIEYLLHSGGLERILLSMPQGENRKANLEFLKARAAEFSRGSFSGLFHFIRYIRELKELEIDYGTMNAPVSSAGGSAEKPENQVNAVQMMTIHKSKGLEFPVVILAGCGKKYNETDLNDSVIPDKYLGLGLEHRDPDSRLVKKTLVMQVIRQEQRNSIYAEEMRLLYVAMTRAKEKLVITGTDAHLETRQQSWEEMRDHPVTAYHLMKAGSFLQLLGMILYPLKDTDSRLQMQCLTEPETEAQRAEELLRNEEAVNALIRLSEQERDVSALRREIEFQYPYEKASRIQGKITASQLEKKDYDPQAQPEEDPEERIEQYPVRTETEGGLSGAERGNAYHRFLELLNYGPFCGQEEQPEEAKAILSKQLKDLTDLGKISERYAAAIDMEKIVRFVYSPVGRRMGRAFSEGRLYREKQFISGTVIDINRESTVTGPASDSDVPDEELLLVQGIIDAWFFETDENGQDGIILLDYKTDRSSDRRHYSEVYAPQQDAYAEALEKSLGIRVREKLIYSFELNEEIRLQ